MPKPKKKNVSLDGIKAVMNEKIFVVSQRWNTRSSDYGKLIAVNDGVNIVLEMIPGMFATCCVPIDNGDDRIIKVYNKEGIVIYDAE